jgi:selenide,water dikinase
VRPDVVVDHAFSDDAAIVKTQTGRDLVLTADVIAPLVDDAETFGAIAAANSLSDVWAMGGEPRFALNLVFFPDDVLPLDVLDAILRGGARVCREAGVATPCAIPSPSSACLSPVTSRPTSCGRIGLRNPVRRSC